jgi:hypothetical protein
MILSLHSQIGDRHLLDIPSPDGQPGTLRLTTPSACRKSGGQRPTKQRWIAVHLGHTGRFE